MVHVYYGVVDKIKSAFMFTLSYDDFLEKWVTYTFRMFAKKKNSAQYSMASFHVYGHITDM